MTGKQGSKSARYSPRAKGAEKSFYSASRVGPKSHGWDQDP